MPLAFSRIGHGNLPLKRDAILLLHVPSRHYQDTFRGKNRFSFPGPMMRTLDERDFASSPQPRGAEIAVIGLEPELDTRLESKVALAVVSACEIVAETIKDKIRVN
jgi:hypothetical protein